MTLHTLIKHHALAVHGELASSRHTGFEFDSRKIKQGHVFIALEGGQTDGHDFVDQALRNGAVCAIVSEKQACDITQIVVKDPLSFLFEWAKAERGSWDNKTVIGLTGSVGKTSHKEMLKVLCEAMGDTHATSGNYNNKLGLSHTILNTPHAAKYVILELGISEVGEMQELAQIAKPDIAYITNIHPCHLSGLSDINTIAREKSKVYSILKETDTAFVNCRDAFVETFLKASQHCRQVKLSDAMTLINDSITVNKQGFATFSIKQGHMIQQCQLAVPGRHQVDNAYAMMVIANHLGLSLNECASQIQAVKPSKGRMAVQVEENSQALIIDDTYNASPQAMHAAIKSLKSICRSKKIAVIGDMKELGKSSDHWHKQVGTWLNEEGINTLFTLGEKAKLAIATFNGQAIGFDDLDNLTSAIQNQLDQDTVVLIKASRSMQLEQCVDQLLCSKIRG